MTSLQTANLRALVVDDDTTMLEIVIAILGDAGLRHIATAHSGHSALDVLDTQPVELLICDLNMPGMDGVQLLGHVATRNERPAIILLSGEDARILEASRQFAEAKRLEVLGVVQKPVEREVLQGLLQRWRRVDATPCAGSRGTPLDEAQLRHGLASGLWHLSYQPKLDLRDGTLAGVEGLLRWHDPDLGACSPLDVVLAAERCGLIDTLTLAVLARAVEDRARLLREGVDIDVAINLSMHNLHSPRFVDRMAGIVTGAGDSPAHYILEITETHLVQDLAQVLEALIRARLLGFRVAIDDYGAGAATMQWLRQLPSTELKIDRSFVAAGPCSAHGHACLQSAVELGLRLGQVVIAEGVEREEEARLALSLGCHLGQGHLYAHPMELDALAAWALTRPQT